MLLHPAFPILIASLLMILGRKNNNFLQILAVSGPLFAFISLFFTPNFDIFNLAQIKFLIHYGALEKLVAASFLIVLFSANLYALSQAKKKELILGSIYGACSLICLFADDLLSLFIALELMMISSTIIIFIGGHRDSISYASRYFFTHLISSNLIMLGIAYLLSQQQIIAVSALPALLKQLISSQPTIYLMLLGLIINIAAFPFSGWMVNCYSKASPTGFLYLISFTSKISLILILKLFPAFHFLQYIGAIMIIYTIFRARKENNIFSLLALLSIMAMGLMLVGISIGSEKALLITYFYLTIHIIYKLLLSLVAANLADQANISHCTQLTKIKNSYLLTSIFAAILMMVNFPLTSSFYLKYALSKLVQDDIIKYIITFLAFFSLYVLPWRQYLRSTITQKIKLTYYQKISLLIPNIALIIIGFFWHYLPNISTLINNSATNMQSFALIKQVIILIFAFLLAYYFSTKRNNRNSFNLLFDLGDLFMILYVRKTKHIEEQTIQESWRINKFNEYLWQKFAKYHNQKSAIFIIFSFLLMLLVSLTTYLKTS